MFYVSQIMFKKVGSVLNQATRFEKTLDIIIDSFSLEFQFLSGVILFRLQEILSYFETHSV
jgi:hypothetical protein